MKRLIVFVMMIIMLLAGCSQQEEKRNVLRVGMECDYAPFNWTQVEDSDTAQPISDVDFADGYDVVVATYLAEKLGMEVEIVKTEWDALIPALNAGAIDCVIAGMTDTPLRREEVNFTTPYYESAMVVIVRKGSELVNIHDIQELSGYRVLGQSNTTYDEIIDQIDGVIHLTPLDKYPRMVLALQSGEADAITAEMPVAIGVVSANPDLEIVQFDADKSFEVDTSVSIAVAKNNTDLLNRLQEALDSLDDQERLNIMTDAVSRQPAGE